MAKAKKQGTPSRRESRGRQQVARADARTKGSRPVAARGAQKRSASDSRRPARQPQSRPATARRGNPDEAMTRVTHETEVRGLETRVERHVERTSKPSLPDVDRSTGRGRYVYCIIQATQPLRFGAIGMDEQSPDVYTINYRDMAAVVSDVPIGAPLDS